MLPRFAAVRSSTAWQALLPLGRVLSGLSDAQLRQELMLDPPATAATEPVPQAVYPSLGFLWPLGGPRPLSEPLVALPAHIEKTTQRINPSKFFNQLPMAASFSGAVLRSLCAAAPAARGEVAIGRPLGGRGMRRLLAELASADAGGEHGSALVSAAQDRLLVMGIPPPSNPRLFGRSRALLLLAALHDLLFLARPRPGVDRHCAQRSCTRSRPACSRWFPSRLSSASRTIHLRQTDPRRSL